MGWHEHDAGLFHGTERFFRPNYAANLVDNWIPALDGVDATLEAGGRVADRVSFEVGTAKSYNRVGYDFVTMFDCLHDMGDSVGAAAHVRDTLTEEGTWMIVEPYASDLVEDNLNPVGRAFYSVLTLVCTPNSLDQGGERPLGAQAGEARIREVVTDGRFTRFRRATETPFNLIFEAKLSSRLSVRAGATFAPPSADFRNVRQSR